MEHEYIEITEENLKEGDILFAAITDIKNVAIRSNNSSDSFNHSFVLLDGICFEEAFIEEYEMIYPDEAEDYSKESRERYEKWANRFITMLKYNGNGQFTEYFSGKTVLLGLGFSNKYSKFEDWTSFKKQLDLFSEYPLAIDKFVKATAEEKIQLGNEINKMSKKIKDVFISEFKVSQEALEEDFKDMVNNEQSIASFENAFMDFGKQR